MGSPVLTHPPAAAALAGTRRFQGYPSSYKGLLTSALGVGFKFFLTSSQVKIDNLQASQWVMCPSQLNIWRKLQWVAEMKKKKKKWNTKGKPKQVTERVFCKAPQPLGPQSEGPAGSAAQREGPERPLRAVGRKHGRAPGREPKREETGRKKMSSTWCHLILRATKIPYSKFLNFNHLIHPEELSL